MSKIMFGRFSAARSWLPSSEHAAIKVSRYFMGWLRSSLQFAGGQRLRSPGLQVFVEEPNNGRTQVFLLGFQVEAVRRTFNEDQLVFHARLLEGLGDQFRLLDRHGLVAGAVEN